jgi:hypothetical protein
MSVGKETVVTSPDTPPDGPGEKMLPGRPHASPQPAELSPETADKIARALGQGLAQCWSRLAQDIQHDVFEAAVTLEGEAIRQQLAVYLHGKHTRTTDAMHARAMPEPDSLGG